METAQDKVVLVTGATDGIGLATAKRLSRAGAKLILHGRNEERLRSTAQELGRAGRMPETVLADLASLKAIHRMGSELAARFPVIDVLINNAGIGTLTGGPGRQLSQDGYELRFAVNYLATFALTMELLPVLEKSPVATVVNVSSAGQMAIDFHDVMLERRYDGVRAYCQSKLAQVLFTFALARRTGGKLAANCLHPGTYLDTKIVREAIGYSLGTPDSGAEAIVHLVELGLARKVTGAYFDVTREARADEQAYDDAARERLWTLSEQLYRDALGR